MPALRQGGTQETDRFGDHSGRLSSASPDGKHLVWLECRGVTGTIFVRPQVFLDGKLQGHDLQYEEVNLRKVVFSPDSQHLAFSAKQGKKEVVVLDGNVQPGTYDKVEIVSFSPDSQHFAFAAKQDQKWVVNLDGKVQGVEHDDKLTPPVVVFQDQSLVIGACQQHRCILSVDGKEKATFGAEHLSGVMVGTNGKGLASLIVHNGGEHAYLLGDTSGPAGSVIGPIVFSPDGTRYAYAAAHVKEGLGWSISGPEVEAKSISGFVVVDGKPSVVHKGFKVLGLQPMPERLLTTFFPPRGLHSFRNSRYCVSDPVFSPDGRRVAYIGRDGSEAAVYVEGEPGRKFDTIRDLRFNQAGQAVYVAIGGNKLTAMTGDRATDELSLPEDEDFAKWGFVDKVQLSPEGKVESYLLGRGGRLYFNNVTSLGKRKLVVGGHHEEEYDCAALSEVRFSPDNRHHAYEVHRIVHGKGIEWKEFPNSFIVIDSKEGKHYDEIVPNSLRFESNDAASYFARDGFRFLRVRENLSR